MDYVMVRNNNGSSEKANLYGWTNCRNSPQERQVTGELLVPLKSYSLIIVEHDLDFIKDICDYITVLDQGKVLETGSIEKIRTSKKFRVYTRV